MLQRARDRLRAAKDELESLGRMDEGRQVGELASGVQRQLREIDPVAARSYPGPGEG